MLEMRKDYVLADKYSTRSVAAGHIELYTKRGAPYVLDAFSVLEYVANVIDLQEGAYAENFQKFFPAGVPLKFLSTVIGLAIVSTSKRIVEI